MVGSKNFHQIAEITSFKDILTMQPQNVSYPQRVLVRACRCGDVTAIENFSATQASLKQIINSIRTDADETLLHIAVAAPRQAVPLTQELLRAGADARARGFGSQAKTALHEAARVGHADVCTLLLAVGASANAVKRGDWTPLMVASAGCHAEAVHVLLQAGADVACINREGATALHLACRAGNTTCVRALLENSADVAAQTHNKRTALHYAARADWPDIVKCLLKAGANPAETDLAGVCAVHDAAAYAGWNTLACLLHPGMWMPDCGGLHVLHHAALGGRPNCISHLLESCEAKVVAEHIDSLDRTGKSPITLAILNGHVDAARVLVSFGAGVQQQWLLLFQRNGHRDLVNQLQKVETYSHPVP